MFLAKRIFFVIVLFFIFFIFAFWQNSSATEEKFNKYSFFLEDPFGKLITNEKDLAYIVTLENASEEPKFNCPETCENNYKAFLKFIKTFTEDSQKQYENSLSDINFNYEDVNYSLKKINKFLNFSPNINLFPNAKQRKHYQYKYDLLPFKDGKPEVIVNLKNENNLDNYEYLFKWEGCWYLSGIKKINLNSLNKTYDNWLNINIVRSDRRYLIVNKNGLNVKNYKVYLKEPSVTKTIVNKESNFKLFFNSFSEDVFLQYSQSNFPIKFVDKYGEDKKIELEVYENKHEDSVEASKKSFLFPNKQQRESFYLNGIKGKIDYEILKINENEQHIVLNIIFLEIDFKVERTYKFIYEDCWRLVEIEV